MKKDDVLKIFFDDTARAILFSLVDNQTPELTTFKDSNDIFNPSISAVFKLFEQLMIANTPDLYLSEWQMIVQAVQRAPKQSPYFRLMDNIYHVHQGLVMMLEDLRDSNNERIDSFELSKKIAGFNSIAATSVAYHIQRFLVANRRGQTYKFPEIKFRG